MKIRKFYKQEVGKIQGPGELLNILGPKTEIEEKEAQDFLDVFFDNHINENSQTVKAEAWSLILEGEQVTINENCISSKVFTVKDKRIANNQKTDK